MEFHFSRQYDEALPLIRRAQALNVSLPEYVFPLGDIYAEKGLYAESISEFLKLGDRPHALGHLGNASARAGKVDAAHDEGLTNLKIDPCLDPLRSDPRFDGLLRHVGLTLETIVAERRHASFNGK